MSGINTKQRFADPVPNFSVEETHKRDKSEINERSSALKTPINRANLDFLKLTAGATPQLLYTTDKFQKGGFVQNLSTDAVSIGIGGQPAIQGQGIILNPAPASGQAGGSWSFGAINLGQISWIAPTTGDLISVYYET